MINIWHKQKNKKTDEFDCIFEKFKDFTMIDRELFIQNLKLIKTHFANRNDGTMLECGVWRGGMAAGIASILGEGWSYHLFDSFEGLPKAKAIDGLAAIKWQSEKNSPFYYDNCKAEKEYCIKVMSLAGVKPVIYPGWFNATLNTFSKESKITLLRLDGDWYDSTMECLDYLFPLVEENGLIIIDDYFAWDGCSKAVHDYLSKIKSNSRLRTDKNLCYIIKSESGRQYN